jgi:capsid protein
VMRLERVQRPIRIGQHVNPSLGGDENGHVRGSVAGLDSAFSSIQDLHRVVYESAHNSLIEATSRCLNLFRALVLLTPLARDPAANFVALAVRLFG